MRRSGKNRSLSLVTPLNEMKINKNTIKFFKNLYWDYQVSEENVVTIIELGEYNGLTRKNLLSRALKSRSWYVLMCNKNPNKIHFSG